ncbi:MAG: DUF4830 domain-containing protein [Ruminococcus sp.]|nr:DUF4830 domain-containing protein [Ruminococcus sp.]
MVVFSFDKRRGIKIAVISFFSLFLIVLCAVIALERKQAVPDYATADEVGRFFTEAADTDAQLRFLNQFGIKADKSTKKHDKVTIPADFGEVYEEYNELQKETGLDLSPFRGTEVSRVVYKLRNKEKYVTLLIFKAHVIGGHLSTGVYGDGYEALNGAIG